MARRKRFRQRIPRKPKFKRDTYIVPDEYSEVYEKTGITDAVEQKMLFHVTQFGGFRCSRLPRYIKQKREFIEDWFRLERDEFGFHTFRANPRFLAEFGDIEMKPLKRIWKIGVLKEGEMDEFGFSEDDIEDSYKFLYALNDFYSDLQLEVPIPASGITIEDRVNLAKFHGTPFLVKKPRAGGRFHHPESSYQRIERSLRRKLTINGEATSEVDISAATLQFLGIALEDHIDTPVFSEIFSHEDPYQYFLEKLNGTFGRVDTDDGFIQREDLKTILYTLIYSSKRAQENSVNRKLRRLGIHCKHSELEFLFPEFFAAVDVLKTEMDFDPHVVIFKEESKYAQKVLERACLELGLPMIPIHDAFVTTPPNVPELQEVMDEASERLYGRTLAHKVKY